MSATIQCPNCRRDYPMRKDMAGRKVRCTGCGHTFQVSEPAVTTGLPPLAKSNVPAQPRSGMDDLLSEAFGDPAAEGSLSEASAWTSGTTLATPRKKRRRRRMKDADRNFLKLGILLAVVGVILLIVFPLLGLVGLLGTLLATLPVLAGGGMVAYASRENVPVAAAAGTAVLVLLVVVFMIRPDARTLEEMSDDLFVQLDQMPQLLESATNEDALAAVHSKVIRLYGSMLRAQDRLSTPDEERSADGRSLEDVIAEYDRRMRQIAPWLPEVPGGAELAYELAMLAQDMEEPVELTPPPDNRAEFKAWKSFGFSMLEYEEKHHVFPPDWDALEAFLQNSPSKLTIAQALRAKEPVVLWNVKFKDFIEIGTSRTVLAYEKEALDGAGVTLCMDGSVHLLGPNDLRDKLNAQVSVVEAATGVAPPTWPPFEFKVESRPPNLTAWVPSGWTMPLPPESPANRKRRLAWHKERLDGPGIYDAVRVFVTGLPGESVAREIEEKLERINVDGSVGAVPCSNQMEWRFFCCYVQDIRKFAFRIDLGRIVEFNESKGEIRIQLDPIRCKKWDLTGDVSPPEPAVATTPPPETEPIDQSAVKPTPKPKAEPTTEPIAKSTPKPRAKRRPKVADPPPKSVGIVPAPPEPAENRRRRQRRSAGPDFVDPNSVDLIFEGASPQVTREISRKIKAVYPQAHSSYQWSKSGESPWKLVVAGVDDIRVFAARLDLGKITRYDEQKGVIEIKLDPAKLPKVRSGASERLVPRGPPFRPEFHR